MFIRYRHLSDRRMTYFFIGIILIYYLNFVAVSFHAKYLYCFIYPPLNSLKIQYFSYITYKTLSYKFSQSRNTRKYINNHLKGPKRYKVWLQPIISMVNPCLTSKVFFSTEHCNVMVNIQYQSVQDTYYNFTHIMGTYISLICKLYLIFGFEWFPCIW